MKKSKWKNLRKNKGTALLFALGVLSVLVVVAMMFASKARVESTISSIQRENLSARILAKSLIPRVIIGINKSTRFQDQLLFSSVASGEDADDDDPDAEGGKKWKEIKDDRKLMKLFFLDIPKENIILNTLSVYALHENNTCDLLYKLPFGN